MERALRESLDTWSYVRSLTYDFISALSPDLLTRNLPRPALDQIGKHLLEMGDVTLAYANGLESGTIAFDQVRWVFPDLDLRSKEAILAHLRESDRALEANLKSALVDSRKKFGMAGDSVTLREVITWLALHEILHHGQLVAYGYLLGIEFPQTWVDQWALPAAK